MRAVVQDLRRRPARGASTSSATRGAAASRPSFCADAGLFRTCVLSTMTWADPPPQGALTLTFGNPLLQLALDAAPGGYLRTADPEYAGLVATSPPEVQLAVMRTQPGTYTVNRFREHGARPWYDPSPARVPAIVLRGAEDPLTSEEDGRALAAALRATFMSIPAGGHIPRLEEDAQAAWWQAVLRFLEVH